MTENVLADYLLAYGKKQWQPGRVDCCLFLAAWAIWLGHRDPADHLRGAYDSEDGFRVIVAASGGVVGVVDRCASAIGARRIPQASCGDIGVIGNTKDIRCQFGAIFDGARWRIRTPAGYRSIVARPLAAWSIL